MIDRGISVRTDQKVLRKHCPKANREDSLIEWRFGHPIVLNYKVVELNQQTLQLAEALRVSLFNNGGAQGLGTPRILGIACQPDSPPSFKPAALRHLYVGVEPWSNLLLK